MKNSPRKDELCEFDEELKGKLCQFNEGQQFRVEIGGVFFLESWPD